DGRSTTLADIIVRQYGSTGAPRANMLGLAVSARREPGVPCRFPAGPRGERRSCGAPQPCATQALRTKTRRQGGSPKGWSGIKTMYGNSKVRRAEAATAHSTGERAPSSPDKVVAAITEGVLRRRYVPGQRLIEADLTHEFKVSRGTIREALKKLAAGG